MKFTSGPDVSLLVENQQLQEENKKLKSELASKPQATLKVKHFCHKEVRLSYGGSTYCMLEPGHKGKCK